MSVEQLTAASSNETHADIVRRCAGGGWGPRLGRWRGTWRRRRWRLQCTAVGGSSRVQRIISHAVWQPRVTTAAARVTCAAVLRARSVREMLSSYEDPTIMFQLQKELAVKEERFEDAQAFQEHIVHEVTHNR